MKPLKQNENLPQEIQDAYAYFLGKIEKTKLDIKREVTAIHNIYYSNHPKASQCRDLLWTIFKMSDNKALPSQQALIYHTLMFCIEYCEHYEVIQSNNRYPQRDTTTTINWN